MAPKKAGLDEEFWIELCGRPLPARRTKDGVRAVVKSRPIDPESVEEYLRDKFGEKLAAVHEAMARLARAFERDELASEAYRLYEQFRPEVARGVGGWGQKGELSIARILSLARRR